MKHFIVGTAGHIDHGKSTLVEALTGTDPDRLPEEKARGMTIDLGFAHLDLPAQEGGGEALSLGLIDVPGHSDFVKNMVAGVGSIDLALFIVAADDGWMPQTEEHLQILEYLGVPRGIVALTKADLIQDEELGEMAVEFIREKLEGTRFAGAPIVKVCALGGDGIGELTAAIRAALDPLPTPPDIGKPRLFVDRVFSPKGVGTVVTGSLTGGRLARGMAVEVQPAGRTAHIRVIQNHSSEVDEAMPGMRTALNLPDVEIASRMQRRGIERGQVVTLPKLGAASNTLDVMLEKSGREVPGQPESLRKIKNGQKVRFHHGSAGLEARVILLEGKELPAGSQALAEIRIDEGQAFAFAGDRFVLRDFANRGTIAGGVILDPDARRRAFHKPAQRAMLEARAAGAGDAEAYVQGGLARDRAAPRGRLGEKSRFSAGEIGSAVEALIAAGIAADIGGGWVADAEWWGELLAAAGASIDRKHEESPELVGPLLTSIRRDYSIQLPDAKLFDAFLTALEARGYAAAGQRIRNLAHQPRLSAALQKAANQIRAALSDNRWTPPSRRKSPRCRRRASLPVPLRFRRSHQPLRKRAALLQPAYGDAVRTVRDYISSTDPPPSATWAARHDPPDLGAAAGSSTPRASPCGRAICAL
ncbi:MAG: selenocysteine-specific translation elongation factor [Verrucomicrobiales bacterium]